MINLVDYDSESSDNEENAETNPKRPLSTIASDDDDNDNWDKFEKSNHVQIRLPALSTERKISEKEDELEDFLRSRRNWEKDLAEKAELERNTTMRPKKRINAFGEFGSLLNKPVINKEPEDDEEDKSSTSSDLKQQERKTKSFGSELLKMLPQPNTKNVKKASEKTFNSLLPNLSTSKQPLKQFSIKDSKLQKHAEIESDNDDDGSADFFGFNSAKIDVNIIPTKTSSQFTFLPEAKIYNDEIMPGPSRPTLTDAPTYKDADDDRPNKRLKLVSDEVAQKLIYDKELAPWGASDSVAREAILNIREVNVDQELGPNVRETLLRNLNNKAMAQASVMPLPKIAKGSQDRLAKQKHQITHLAQMAVAREEQLQEQWAENKSKRISTAKRYGFR